MALAPVFDANILFSAVGAWRGPPYHCLQLALRGAVQSISCQEILGELATKLPLKAHFSAAQVAFTIARLRSVMRVVTIPNQLQGILADPDDHKVLECAVFGYATHIVTGDKKHLLPLGSYQGIPIITARDFLAVATTP